SDADLIAASYASVVWRRRSSACRAASWSWTALELRSIAWLDTRLPACSSSDALGAERQPAQDGWRSSRRVSSVGYTPGERWRTRRQEVSMGLLDDLLGGLAGQAMGGRGQQERTQARSEGGGMNQIFMSLMPIVLGVLANRGSAGGSPTQMGYAPRGGGLGDVLGQVLGGAGAAGGARRVPRAPRRQGLGRHGQPPGGRRGHPAQSPHPPAPDL